MTKAEAGAIGGKVTAARYGTETITCPIDGRICEHRTCFTEERAENGPGRAADQRNRLVDVT